MSFDLNRVHLRYALQDGQRVSVRVFEHLRGTKQRPTDLYCPQCESRITVKLPEDEKIRDHFAHYPDSDCPLRGGGETAHHLNAKIYLAEQLARFHHATLSYKCGRCRSEYAYLRIDDYDEVVPEMKIGKRKPDITCLHAGEAIGAAEIYHTHAVCTEKKYDLDQMGLSWFEIPALSVHPQYFRFIEASDVISIDAQGASVTYPAPPSFCEPCAVEVSRWHAAEQEANARLRRMSEEAEALRAQQVEADARQSRYWEQRRSERQRREIAQRETNWKKFKSLLSPDSEDAGLARSVDRAGIVPDVDQYGIRLMPGMETMLYLCVIARRKAIYQKLKNMVDVPEE